MKFAIITTGGKQYQISENDKLNVEKLPGAEGAELKFDKVLLVADVDKDKEADVNVGAPYVSGALVTAKIMKQDRADKVTIIKYKAKTRHRTKRGHRQPFTQLQITGIKDKF